MVDDSRFLSTCLSCVLSSSRNKPNKRNETIVPWSIDTRRHAVSNSWWGMSMNYLIISVHTVNLAQKKRLSMSVVWFVWSFSFGFFFITIRKILFLSLSPRIDYTIVLEPSRKPVKPERVPSRNNFPIEIATWTF